VINNAGVTNHGKLFTLRDQGKLPGFISESLKHAIEKSGKLKEFLQFSGVFPVVNTTTTDVVFEAIMEILVFSIFPCAPDAKGPNTAQELYSAAAALGKPLGEDEKNNYMGVYLPDMRDSLLLIGSIVQNCYESVDEKGDFIMRIVHPYAEELSKISGLEDIWIAIGDTMNVIETRLHEKLSQQGEQQATSPDDKLFHVRYQ